MASMILVAASTVVVMEEVMESLRESLWYVTPSTFGDGVLPMLKTWFIDLAVRNGADEADEQGPRKSAPGRMTEAASDGCFADACAFFLFTMVARVKQSTVTMATADGTPQHCLSYLA